MVKKNAPRLQISNVRVVCAAVEGGKRAIATVLATFDCCDAVIADADQNDSPPLSLSARSCADSWGGC